jgi:hypothetical protein
MYINVIILTLYITFMFSLDLGSKEAKFCFFREPSVIENILKLNDSQASFKNKSKNRNKLKNELKIYQTNFTNRLK